MSFFHTQTSEKEIPQTHPSVTYFLIFLLLTIQLLWFLNSPLLLTDGGIVGSDSYMHLNRVVHLVESGEWFHAVYPRSNAPYGELLHWTRLMDILLLSGAGLLTVFVPFSTALHWWGVSFGPVVHICAVLSLIWMMRPVFDREHQLLAGGLFLLQPALFQSFLAGRPDHHGVLVVCFIVLLGITYRICATSLSRKWCVAAGWMMAIAMWASVESLTMLWVCLSSLAMGWVWYGTDWGRRNLVVTGVLSVVTFVVLLVDRGFEEIFYSEYDRLSFVHWSLFALIASFWIAVWLKERMGRKDSTLGQRVGLGVGGLTVVLGMHWVCFPKFLHGPLVDVHPEMMTLLWNRVAETQPLLGMETWQIGRLILFLGIAFPALPYLLWLIRVEACVAHRWFWCMVGMGAIVFLPLALLEARWAPYAELLMLLPYTHLMGKVFQKVADPIRAPWNSVVKASLVLVGAMWCLFVGTKMLEAEAGGIRAVTPQDCPIIPLSRYLNNPTGFGRDKQTILAFIDFGPELLYRTAHQVIMTPYHRNAAGNLDAYRIMSDPTNTIAKQVLQTRMVDLIVTCPSSPTESSFFRSSEQSLSFYDRLNQGRVPRWIREVQLPSSLAVHFKLFQVQQSQEDPT
ncbi:MAG: hypothetical protein NPIRA02_28600 [Nitrospirales bacterium]|nr:MAG: hypothetical protein NPIRA02_28600 [Nitrospirales bacterium]